MWTVPVVQVMGPRYVSGPIRVDGFDLYGLDADNDGIGCDAVALGKRWLIRYGRMGA